MKKIITAVAASAALLTCGGAFAQGYVGGSVGATSIDFDCQGAPQCDDGDIGFKLYGGYGFGNGFAIEGTYFNYGEVSASGNSPLGFAKLSLKGYGIGVGVAGTAQFSPLVSGTARIGIASATTKASASIGSRSGSDDETSTVPYFGLALGFNVAPGLTVETGIDFTRFEYESEKADARLFSVGVKYRF